MSKITIVKGKIKLCLQAFILADLRHIIKNTKENFFEIEFASVFFDHALKVKRMKKRAYQPWNKKS